MPGSQDVLKIRRARLRKGDGGGGGDGGIPARFSHFFLLNDFSPLSWSLEQANSLFELQQVYQLGPSGSGR